MVQGPKRAPKAGVKRKGKDKDEGQRRKKKQSI